MRWQFKVEILLFSIVTWLVVKDVMEYMLYRLPNMMNVVCVVEIVLVTAVTVQNGLWLKMMTAVFFRCCYIFYAEGVCGGSNACYDCTGTPWGDYTYDSCGNCLLVTDENFDSCVGCDDVTWSLLDFDSCGVCNGTVAINSNFSHIKRMPVSDVIILRILEIPTIFVEYVMAMVLPA